MKKAILLPLGLFLVAACIAAVERQIPSTAYTRDFLRATNAAAARTKLEITGSTGMNTNQFTTNAVGSPIEGTVTFAGTVNLTNPASVFAGILQATNLTGQVPNASLLQSNSYNGSFTGNVGPQTNIAIWVASIASQLILQDEQMEGVNLFGSDSQLQVAGTVVADYGFTGDGSGLTNLTTIGNGGVVTNNGLVWLVTNAVPNSALPNGSFATVTTGRFFVRTNSAWVEK